MTVDAGVLFPDMFACRDAIGEIVVIGRCVEDVEMRVSGEADEDDDEKQ
jgi:hypothetical protein